MARKGTNTRVEAANNRKASSKAEKEAQKLAELEAKESAKWAKGAKKNDKKEQEAEKKAAALAKKLEKQKLLEEEEKALNKPKAPKPNYTKKSSVFSTQRTAAPKSKIPTELYEKDEEPKKTKPILTEKDIEKHPERRFKMALSNFEERELKNYRAEYPGLRLSQLKEIMYKDFQKSADNPFNQSNVFSYNTSIDEVNRKINGEPEPTEEEEEGEDEEGQEESQEGTQAQEEAPTSVLVIEPAAASKKAVASY